MASELVERVLAKVVREQRERKGRGGGGGGGEEEGTGGEKVRRERGREGGKEREREREWESFWKGMKYYTYSKTSLSGHSEKRTHSLQRTMWQSRIEKPVYVIH